MGEGFPLWSMVSMAAEGREPLRDWISLFVSFCFCAPIFCVSPFLKFPEIRNSDWAEILTRFSSGYYLSCGDRRAPTVLRSGHKPPAVGPPPGRGDRACGHSVHRLALILLPKNHKYSKKIPVSFYYVWTSFGMDIL